MTKKQKEYLHWEPTVQDAINACNRKINCHNFLANNPNSFIYSRAGKFAQETGATNGFIHRGNIKAHRIMSAYFQKANDVPKKKRRGIILPKLKEEFTGFTFHCYIDLQEKIVLDTMNVDDRIWAVFESKRYNWNREQRRSSK